MPELLVQCPGQPDAVVPLGAKPVLIGRGEDCPVWIPEKKASRKHLRITALGEGGYVADDLGSANGTFLGERRILRAVVQPGDVLRIGDTTIALRHAGGEAPLVGGTIALQPVLAPAAAPAEVAPPPPAAHGSEEAADAEPRVVRAPIDMQKLGRALVLLVVAGFGIGAVEVFLGGQAREAAKGADARNEQRAILQRLEVSTAAQVESDVALFRLTHPRAVREAELLDRWLAYVRQHETQRTRTEERLNQLVQGIGTLPESEVRAGLLALRSEQGQAGDLTVRIAIALSQIDRRTADDALASVDDAVRRAEALLLAERPGPALRVLSAVRLAWPILPEDARGSLKSAEARAIAAANDIAAKALAAAEKETDLDRQRAILTRAWRGLDGTPQGDRLAETLRYARRTDRMTERPSATPSGPTAPPPGTDVLVRAAEAEKFFGTRRWADARDRFVALMGEVKTGLLHEEWAHRVGEVDRILALVSELGKAASSPTPPKRTLFQGNVTVVAATPDAVTWKREAETVTTPWRDVAERDVLPLLTPESPTAEQRLSVAILAATVSDRDSMVAVLIPLFEKGERVDDASRLVARYLYGRAAPPEGGYRVYAGQILDRAGYERKREEERLASLRLQAEELLTRVAKDPAFHKLEKLRELRNELDERRRYALLAIFNETHYPYPYDKGSQPYQVVQREVDRRVALVREIWEDPAKATIKRSGTLEKALDEWARVIADLKAAEQDVTDLDSRMTAYEAYVTGEPMTVREYFRDLEERDLFRYNRWVMQVYNPSKTSEASEAEREQSRITNEYRMMLGYTGYGLVVPGPAPYPSVEDKNVVKVLDAGKLATDLPLMKAVRVDDRLVRAARLHSEDMTKRGYFAHEGKPNPATGEGPTLPWDRMKKQGYTGGAASENIAQAGDPMTAHVMWCHSSGHHRNILSGWADQGAGFYGSNWTQNYGNGGGEPTEIPEGVEVPATSGHGPKDRR